MKPFKLFLIIAICIFCSTGGVWGQCVNALTVNVAGSNTGVRITSAVITPSTNQTVAIGAPFSFSVASMCGNVTYQWKRNGVNIPNATGSSYSKPFATAADAGDYTVVISSDYSTDIISTMTTLNIMGCVSSLSIASPTSLGGVVCLGGSTTIRATVTGGVPPYEYSLDDRIYQTNPALTVGSGIYTITVKDASGCKRTSTPITIGDAPQPILCPLPIQIDCDKLTADGKVPTNVSGDLQIFRFCFTPDSVGFSDQSYDVACGITNAPTNINLNPDFVNNAQRILVRTFSASQNLVRYFCSQTIYINRPKIEEVTFPSSRTLACTNLRTAPSDTTINGVFVAGTGTPNLPTCNISLNVANEFNVTYKDVRITTSTGFMIQRTWTVIRCGGAGIGLNSTRTFVQTITVPTCTTSSIAGATNRENGLPVPATTVLYNMVQGRTDSTTGATYSFTNLPLNSSFRVVPKRPNTDWTNGVTTLDLALISRHLLDLNPITSPYNLISSDANRDGTVDATDMLLLRRLILRQVEGLTNNNSWRFVLKNHVFTNPTNPFTSDFPEMLVVPNLTNPLANVDFVAIKVGDINQSAGTVEIRGGQKPFTLTTEDMVIEQGKAYRIPIQMTPSVSALQFTLSVDKNAAKIENIEKGDLLNFTDNNMGFFKNEGLVTTAWEQKVATAINETEKTTMMMLTLKATKTTRLSEIMSINSFYTEGIAYDAQGKGSSVKLEFVNKQSSTEKLVLLPNRPNPFHEETTLAFILPEEGKAKLTVCDLLGKVVMTREQVFAKGLNEVVFTGSNNPSIINGVFVVRLQTAAGILEQKILLSR
jgi:hypothetical protein